MMGCGLMLRGSGLWEVERRGRSQKGPEAEPISSEMGRWRRWATEGRASFGPTERERISSTTPSDTKQHTLSRSCDMFTAWIRHNV